MAVKTKPKFKGKYPGPDKYKGDKKKIAAAAKRRAANKKPTKTTPPAAAPAAAPTNAPVAPPNAYTGSNSSGTVGLQTNLDIENQALENEQAKKDALTQSVMNQQLNNANRTANSIDVEKSYKDQRAQTNANMAMRGMRGDVASDASTKDASDNNAMVSRVQEAWKANDTAAKLSGTNAETSYNTRKGLLDTARNEYTNSRSAANPTEGSSPEDSGVNPTQVPAPSVNTTAVKAVKAGTNKPKPTYKGKYKGPDRFKGNAKKIATFRAAKRKSVRK